MQIQLMSEVLLFRATQKAQKSLGVGEWSPGDLYRISIFPTLVHTSLKCIKICFSKAEQTKPPLFSRTVFTGYGSGLNFVSANSPYLLLFREFQLLALILTK